MRSISLHAIALVAALLLATNALASEDVRALIKRQSQEFSEASASGDARVLDRYLDENVIFMDESGAIASKHDIVASAVPSPAGVSNTLVQSDLDIKLHGDVAVTSFTDSANVNAYGEKYTARFRSTEVWMRKNGTWKMISSQTLALSDDPPHIQLAAAALDQYVGTYSLGNQAVVKIVRDGDGLASATNGGKSNPLLVEARDVLFTPGQPRLRRIFERDAKGTITGFTARHEGHGLHFERVA